VSRRAGVGNKWCAGLNARGSQIKLSHFEPVAGNARQRPDRFHARRRAPPLHYACTLPTARQRDKKSRGGVVGGDVLGVASEGVPGVGVAEPVDVIVKKNLVWAHAVSLKDTCEGVVVCVETLVAPVGVDRSSRGRKSATRAAGARGLRAGDKLEREAADRAPEDRFKYAGSGSRN
jgi:hypothetical protein